MEEEKQGIPMGINRLAVIASTKGEVYRLLKHTGKYYMPPLSYSDADFVHDVITGIKKVFKQDQIKTISVPYLKSLKISDILSFAERNCEFQKFIPDLNGKRIPPREYICNIINTLIPKEFSEFIKSKVNVQEEKYIAKRNMRLLVLPEFKELFENSNTISRFHGKFPGIVKNVSKRRIVKEKRIVDQNALDKIELDSMMKDEKILAMEIRINEYKESALKNDENLQKLSKLYELGIIDEEGEPITND